jgi:hypothetical protein
MGLIKAVKNAISTQHAPANIATQNSSIALATSAGAMRALQESGRKDVQIISQMTNAVAKAGELPQKTTNALATSAGGVTQRYQQLKALEQPIMAALDDAKKAADLRAKITKKASDVGQHIAVVDAKTQAAIGHSHQQAHAEVNYHQASYGFSV